MASFFITLIILVMRLPCVVYSRACSCDPILVPCDFTGVYCSKHDFCKTLKENVALGKPTSVKSVYQKSSYFEGDVSFLGCLAVNGNTEAHYLSPKNPKTRINSNCYRSGERDLTPFWEVDLGRRYTINEITIVVDSAHMDLMMNVDIHVDDILCHKFTHVTIVQPHMTHIRCNIPLSGKIVKLSKKSPLESRQSSTNMMAFCEVQVWVCKKGVYGDDCDQECGKGCINCDNYHGTCSRCVVGYFGKHCNMKCQCGDLKGCSMDGTCLGKRLSQKPEPEPEDEEDTEKRTSKNVTIVVIVFGGFCVLGIIIGISYWCYISRKNPGREYNVMPTIRSETTGGSYYTTGGSETTGGSTKYGGRLMNEYQDFTDDPTVSLRDEDGSEIRRGSVKKGIQRFEKIERMADVERTWNNTNASHYSDESEYTYYLGFRRVR